MAPFAPLLPKGNRKGGECGKGAGCHERLEIYKPQGSGRCVSPAGQQEDRDDPHTYSAEKANPASGFMVLHSFLSLGIRYKEKIDLSSKEG